MHRAAAIVVTLLSGSAVAFGASEWRAPATLPVQATNALSSGLTAAMRHASHVWRDTPPFNADGEVNGYVEIARATAANRNSTSKANRRASIARRRKRRRLPGQLRLRAADHLLRRRPLRRAGAGRAHRRRPAGQGRNRRPDADGRREGRLQSGDFTNGDRRPPAPCPHERRASTADRRLLQTVTRRTRRASSRKCRAGAARPKVCPT